jgi:ribosomal protein S18 acetylase RimI-like enzyme
MKKFVFAVFRFLLGLRRPSKRRNAGLLRTRGETLPSLVIREATAADIPALAELHVKTWNATYAPMLMNGPTVTIREQQWCEAFAKADGSWFCFVVERRDGALVGFAKGVRNEQPESSGELNKIYLLGDYQRLGFGRRLVGHVTRRFLSQGVSSMSSYVDPRNPSRGFYEALGAEWLREADGKVNYSWYVWRDLPRLA